MEHAKTVHALLVGINAYPVAPLHGCVNDALAVSAFFQTACAQAGYRWRPLHLFAPNEQDLPNINAAGVGHWEAPTRSNIIAAFDHFSGAAVAPNDVCLLFFSGHGSQEPAGPEFRHLKADGNNETLVCLDSRQPGGRDLVDKELAWLLWRIAQIHPTVHTLVLMDCCHSGDNTRTAAASVRERRMIARHAGTPFRELLGIQDLLGAENGLFSLHGGRAEYRAEGRYVQLAAARDQETAKELCINGRPRGVFTWSLLRVLEHGGLGLSCRETLSRVETLVRSRVQGQIPQLFASPPDLASQQILGGAPGETALGYPVFFQNGRWRMRAGSLHGIVPGTEACPLQVALVNGSRACVTALEVGPDSTVLDPRPFAPTDRHEDKLSALVRQMPVPRLQIFRTPMPASQQEALEAALQRRNLLFADFNAHNSEHADYHVVVENKHFFLLPPAGNVPAFHRMSHPDDFVRACEQLGKWRFALELHHPHARLNRSDIEIVVEKIEGQAVTPASLNHLYGTTMTDPASIEIRYTKEHDRWLAPALRCSVRAKKSGYWVGGLFLDSQFGIADYLEPRPLDAGQEHQFRFPFQNTLFNAIPLTLDARLAAQGVEEIVDYLKIFVSDSDFRLEHWCQEPLPTEAETVRSAAFETNPIPSAPDWMAITVPIHVIRR